MVSVYIVRCKFSDSDKEQACNERYRGPKIAQMLANLRGTAATRFYIAGLSVRVIAEIMGWEEEYVTSAARQQLGRPSSSLIVPTGAKDEQNLQNH